MSTDDVMDLLAAENEDLDSNPFYERFTGPIGLVYIAFVILIMVYMFLRNTIVRCLGACCEKCCGGSKSKEEMRAESSTYSVSEDFVSEIKFGPLYEYFKRSELEYRAL